MILQKVSAVHPDFIALTSALDKELAARYGKAQVAYVTLNKLPAIDTAMVGYEDGLPSACGCFKPFVHETGPGGVEIKRMFVREQARGQGFGFTLLSALEAWARERMHTRAFLETGKRQPEAIALYRKAGYTLIPNFGPYKDMENSICMAKDLI